MVWGLGFGGGGASRVNVCVCRARTRACGVCVCVCARARARVSRNNVFACLEDGVGDEVGPGGVGAVLELAADGEELVVQREHRHRAHAAEKGTFRARRTLYSIFGCAFCPFSAEKGNFRLGDCFRDRADGDPRCAS